MGAVIFNSFYASSNFGFHMFLRVNLVLIGHSF